MKKIITAILILFLLISFGCTQPLEPYTPPANEDDTGLGTTVDEGDTGGLEIQDYGTEEEAYAALESELEGFDDLSAEMKDELAELEEDFDIEAIKKAALENIVTEKPKAKSKKKGKK